MPKNTMDDLRDHLFEQLEELRDRDKQPDTERAKAVCAVADRLIETAKVEVQLARTTGVELGSPFWEPKSKRIGARPQARLAGETED